MNSNKIGALALALLCLPGSVTGQVDRGASVGAGVSATNMDARTEPSFSGAFGYRFTNVVGLEIETTVVPKLKSEFPGVTIPTTSTRLEPFFVAGGGIASLRHEADLVYSFPTIVPVPLPGVPSLPTIPGRTQTQTQHLKSSSVAMALTLGGGLGVRVASQMSIDADLRLFRILGDEDQNVGRFGVGVRYRF